MRSFGIYVFLAGIFYPVLGFIGYVVFHLDSPNVFEASVLSLLIGIGLITIAGKPNESESEAREQAGNETELEGTS